jgi:hypothetical protein
MGKHKYIESPEILHPEIEFDLPYKKTKEGCYNLLPNTKHIGGKNCLRDLAAKKVKEGYVYFININNTNTYKIGVSTSPKKRLANIASVLPYELNVLALNKVKSPYIVEQSLIDKFKRKLIKNEWFSLNHDEVKYILISLHNQQVKDYVQPTN